MKQIRTCPACNEYTMRETCNKCGLKTQNIIPPRYSPEDKYGKYRREIKQKEREERGML